MKEKHKQHKIASSSPVLQAVGNLMIQDEKEREIVLLSWYKFADL